MNIKRNDNVLVLAGKDKGKSGKVLQVFADLNRASVEGVNLLIKHMRPRNKNEKGQRIEFAAPLNISNLALICPKCGKPTRIAHKVLISEDKKKHNKVRVCKKCQANID
ncbi:MAG: 50S ribosomal protein L24 [Candidatus Falkowbacteria bacterium]|nr:50S ribosomal protein L24 [Candidatus Falkowbacteria bacterium]